MTGRFVRVRHCAHREMRRSEAGTAIVEFAIVLPLMVLVMVGTVDFARIFYAANVVSQAVRSGAQYGVRAAKSTDYAGMQDAATNAASDLTGFTATASRLCECTGSPGTPIACGSSPQCQNGQRKLTYVKVVGNYTFTMIFGFPAVPSSIPISRTAWMQVP